MLGEIREGGEDVCKAYAEKLDNYTGPIVLSETDVEEQTKDIPDQVGRLLEDIFYILSSQDKADIDFLVNQVTMFASETRNKISDWEMDLGNGSVAGTK